MKWIQNYDLILLDMDGLLVDTERLHFAAYQALAKRYGYELSWDMDQYLKVAHSSAEGLKEAIHPHISATQKEWSQLYEEKKAIYLDLLHKGTVALMPGVKEFLSELFRSGKKSCVVTNSPKEQVDVIRKALPILEGIPNWVTREVYERPKPAPDGYLKALDLLAVDGDRVVGFEDSLKGIEALEGAGVEAVLVSPTSPYKTFQDISIQHIHKK
ncbi:MAG: HAD family phosphatase [Simkaniaceae bacterium]|nr:HAD family phosphatase [Candidatus Sacchlamyda saccharinae]